jgi:NTP pyrophosphatase (non-canonical NTP hydrolase)
LSNTKILWGVILTLESSIEALNRFALDRDWNQFHSPKNLASSISIEASELLEIFQWVDHSREEIGNDEKLSQQISEEIADVMIYCLRLCSTLDLNPISIINDKIQLNGEKYPIEKSIGSNLKSNKL